MTEQIAVEIQSNTQTSEEVMSHHNDCGIAREQTVVDMGLASEATSQRGFNHADGTAQRMAIAELDATNDVAKEVCDSTRDVIGAVERLGLENLNATRAMGLEGLNATRTFGLEGIEQTERSADKTQADIARSADKTQDEVEKFGFRELEAIAASERHIYAGMSQNAKDILLFNAQEFERVKLQAAENTDKIKSQQFQDTKELLLQGCHDTDKILSKSADQFKDLLLQNCNDTAAIKMQAEIHAKDAALAACELKHQADKNTAAIQLEAFRHKEELARQIAECCCEQKELTREKACETQALIREIDKDRIRDERDKLREELIALRVRSTLPPLPVASVTV